VENEKICKTEFGNRSQTKEIATERIAKAIKCDRTYDTSFDVKPATAAVHDLLHLQHLVALSE
jgi:hypothetical protein